MIFATEKTELNGVYKVHLENFSDDRGQIVNLFDTGQFPTFKVDKLSKSKRNVLRGLHGDATNDKLTITNSQIYNVSSFGILGRATSIRAENLVINNAGQSSFAGTYGGKYNFTHCTIANYWNSSFRQFPALLLNDFIVDENNTVFTNDLVEANFNNCIIYGNDNPEFLLENEGEVFNYKFTNCLLRFDNNNLDGQGNYDFENLTFYENNLFNQDPDFEDPFSNKMRIGADSAADGIGLSIFASQVPNDILNVSRTVDPDAGAYQSVVFDED